MIDLHTHLLPGIDDGPKEISGTLAMIREGLAEGATGFVTTPHVMPVRWTSTRETILQAVADLEAEVHRHGLPVMIYPGSEVFLDPFLLDLHQQGQLMTLAGKGQHLLVEMPAGEIPRYAEDLLYEIQLLGLTPILAHPERNRGVMEDPNRLLPFLNRGYLAQMNTGSITGVFGKAVQETAQILLEHGMVQCLGSDGHSVEKRPIRLAQAVKRVQEILGPQAAWQLTHENPQTLVNGGELEAQIREYRPRRWWQIFPR